MRFGDILVCLDHTASGSQRMAIALALAAHSQARLIGYYATPRRGPPEEDFLDVPLTTVIENKAADFDRQVRLRNIEGTWVMGDSSRTVEDLAKYSRCVDLLVAGLGDPDDAGSEHNVVDIEKLVIACGRPVLGTPITTTADQVGKNSPSCAMRARSGWYRSKATRGRSPHPMKPWRISSGWAYRQRWTSRSTCSSPSARRSSAGSTPTRSTSSSPAPSAILAWPSTSSAAPADHYSIR